MEQKTAIVWFRRDLRLADNPALHHAVQEKMKIVPVFIWDPASERPWEPGAASQWWFHYSLEKLEKSLQAYGSRLILRFGDSASELDKLILETKAQAVFWNRLYEPALIARDKKIKSSLHDRGLTADSFNAALLVEPWQVMNSSGKPYQVFTPFWRSVRAQYTPVRPPAAPIELLSPQTWPTSLELSELGLLPARDWAE